MDTNIKNPKITVLMPVYNGEKYLREAIESILNQTFTDFEFLIINDGSTDKSEEIIRSYNDSRIRLVNNESNIGLTKSLNKGLDLAKSEYIARMDADDISLSKRLEIQINFMKKHPEIGIAGTWAKIIGKNKIIKCPINSEKIRVVFLFKCSLIHPSVIIRKENLKKCFLKYDEKLKQAQDYDLWSRTIKYFLITNIKKILIQYRIHNFNVSKTQSITQNKTATQTRIRQIQENLKINPSNEEVLIHENIYKPKNYETIDFIKKEETWLEKLIKQNSLTKFYKEPIFSQIISQRWLQICSVNSNNNLNVFKIFWKSDLRKKLDLKDYENWKLLIRFFIKCFIKKF